jgi:hypothetical protein
VRGESPVEAEDNPGSADGVLKHDVEVALVAGGHLNPATIKCRDDLVSSYRGLLNE